MRDLVTYVLVMILKWWLRKSGADVDIEDARTQDDLCSDDCEECGSEDFVAQDIVPGTPYKALSTVCASCLKRVDVVRDLDQDPNDEPWACSCGNVWVALWDEKLPWRDFQVES